VQQAGGNWLESHLSRLGGTYVGSVLVEIAADRLAAFEDAIRAVDSLGLRVVLAPAGEEPALAGDVLDVELVGQDRPGIVHEVTGVLEGLGVNIEELATGTENSAWSGDMLFRARMRLRLPQGTTSDAVRAALEAISGEIMVDFTFS
jgi:glycine cleavage system regulatory protein